MCTNDSIWSQKEHNCFYILSTILHFDVYLCDCCQTVNCILFQIVFGFNKSKHLTNLGYLSISNQLEINQAIHIHVTLSAASFFIIENNFYYVTSALFTDTHIYVYICVCLCHDACQYKLKASAYWIIYKHYYYYKRPVATGWLQTTCFLNISH